MDYLRKVSIRYPEDITEWMYLVNEDWEIAIVLKWVYQKDRRDELIISHWNSENEVPDYRRAYTYESLVKKLHAKEWQVLEWINEDELFWYEMKDWVPYISKDNKKLKEEKQESEKSSNTWPFEWNEYWWGYNK